MKPGREFDLLISEKVLGYTSEWRKTAGCLCTMRESCEACGGPMPYSTDIKAAMEVFEKVGDYWYLHFVDGKYEIYENFRAIEDGEPFAAAETAPLAICLAALKTL
ncbi:MAG: BC1872 family protein [Bdellovibrio sp.]